jgi:hypothetical protein
MAKLRKMFWLLDVTQRVHAKVKQRAPVGQDVQ